MKTTINNVAYKGQKAAVAVAAKMGLTIQTNRWREEATSV